MGVYPDTSFFCALYREQDNTHRARRFAEAFNVALPITMLLHFEFAQATRLEVFRHTRDHTKGFSELEGMNMLARFENDIDRGAITIVHFDMLDVLRRATQISENQTIRRGSRAFDILHVATALSLGADTFLTFDPRLRSLGEALALKVGP